MLLTIVFGFSFTIAAQTVRQKLEQQTDYQPRAVKPDEQLIEVARHFQIPMAIEWLDENPQPDESAKLKFVKGPVLDLIKAIMDRAPLQNLIVEDRIVRIFAPSAFSSRLNFLNLKLRAYCVSSESVQGANFALRVNIDEILYPEYFKNGFNGGYGGGEELFWIKAINICLDHRSIRDLLTEIAAQSGKAIWIVNLKPAELNRKEPFWKGVPVNEYGTSPLTGRWVFIPLREDD